MRVSNMRGHRHTGGLMGLYGPHSYSAQTSDLPIGVWLHENILPSGDSRGEKRLQQQWVEKC